MILDLARRPRRESN